jgi:hypothetical protein
MLVVRLDHDGGKNRQTYRGYVSLYSELITDNLERLDDDAWLERILQKAPPPPPAWLEPVLAH